jgi:hypothetical protein
MLNWLVLREGLDIISGLASTDTTTVAHFCETTRVITALTKGLNSVPEETSLLVKCHELYPALDVAGVPDTVEVFTNFNADVNEITSPRDCIEGGARSVKQYFVVGQLTPGWGAYECTMVLDHTDPTLVVDNNPIPNLIED